jgi:5-(carboxyamino)imidazole ribonucleotide mutase
MIYSKKSLIGIIMGSRTDSKIMLFAATILDDFGIKHEDQIVSAHRTPNRLSDYAKHAESEGFRVIIAGAGGSAHLPGMIASHTTIPVIGVPIMVYNDKENSDKFKFSAFGGLDALLSISEMPTGSPVVTVGINKAANAGLYAVKILANEFSDLKEKLMKHKENQHRSVLEESEEMKKLALGKFTVKKFKK